MVNRAATVSWSTMLADVLDAPVAKLTVGDNVDTIEDLCDARTLRRCKSVVKQIHEIDYVGRETPI